MSTGPGLRLTPELREQLLRNDRQAWQRMQALVLRCARVGAYRAGVSFLYEEVASELLLLLHSSFLSRLDDGAALQPFLMEAARRVALAQRRQMGLTHEVPAEEDDGEEPAHEPATTAEDEERLDLRIDAQAARQRVLRRAAELFASQDEKPAYERKQYGCGSWDLAGELKHERKRRGWTQRQMAAYMGLKLPTYISYEHACVKSPNPDIVAMLRTMQAESL
ncbi:MAG: helix-turn-helix domain-containing protein [Rhodocyclaceae bacterium]|nr:helix-turn-helix domain-containing protein [Rhodocyclaceae bacterium]